jgi:photosystem II stability/assembly factor-like uncharacterized protein
MNLSPRPAATIRLLSLLPIVVMGWVSLNAAYGRAEPRSSPPEMLEDATLFDLQFVDLKHGWAVGDRGVIWQTRDGGQSWHLADSPVNCRLDSVCFLDQQQGWAVGGWLQPYRPRSSGVVLKTENGGRRWQRLELPTLPALHTIQMMNARQGWALGDRSAMYPSGLYRTEDGGRSWHDPAVGNELPWNALVMDERGRGWLAGPDGRLGRLSERRQIHAGEPRAPARQLHALQMQGTRGWAVGDGGLVLSTQDGGQSFQSIRLPLSAEECFDAMAVAAVGEHVWIVGTSGNLVWHSADGGQHWERQPTGITTPLYTVRFLDAQRGWAAGALGTILATRDGGRTWQVQRSGGHRAAYLVIVSEPQKIPFALLARLSGDEGYLGAVEVLWQPDSTRLPRLATSLANRTWAAVSATGAAHARQAWQFPLSPVSVASKTIPDSTFASTPSPGNASLPSVSGSRIPILANQFGKQISPVILGAGSQHRLAPLADFANKTALGSGTSAFHVLSGESYPHAAHFIDADNHDQPLVNAAETFPSHSSSSHPVSGPSPGSHGKTAFNQTDHGGDGHHPQSHRPRSQPDGAARGLSSVPDAASQSDGRLSQMADAFPQSSAALGMSMRELGSPGVIAVGNEVRDQRGSARGLDPQGTPDSPSPGSTSGGSPRFSFDRNVSGWVDVNQRPYTNQAANHDRSSAAAQPSRINVPDEVGRLTTEAKFLPSNDTRATHNSLSGEGNRVALPASDFGRDHVGAESSGNEPMAAGENDLNRLPSEVVDGRWEAYLVTLIRQWKPEIIITEHVRPGGADQLALQTNQRVLAAVRRAAEPAPGSVDSDPSALPPWRVKKVFSMLPSDQSGTMQLEHARVSPRLGSTLGDEAAHARSLLAESWQPDERKSQFQLLVNQLPQATGRHDFFSGLVLEPGGGARREAPGPATQDISRLTRLARKKGLLEQLLLRSSEDPTRAASWLAQLDDLTADLDSHASGHTLYDLAQHYQQNGQPDLAADVHTALLRRYPDHDLADSSWLWLIRYYGSREIARWSAPSGWRLNPEQTAAAVPTGGVVTAGFTEAIPSRATDHTAPRSPEDRTGVSTPPGAGEQPKIVRLGTGEPLLATPLRTGHALQWTTHRQPVRADRAARAQELLESLRRTRPTLYAEPEVQMLAAVQARTTRAAWNEPNDREVQPLLAALARSPHRSWRNAALGELWLLGLETGPIPKPRLTCPAANARPQLDGELSDTTWSSEPTAVLTNSNADPTSLPATEVWLAYDDEFFYLAARVQKASLLNYARPSGPRSRDTDLRTHDRLQVMIDIDRDCSTAFLLSIDHRGWPEEACVVRRESGRFDAAASRWNPTWYIAQAESPAQWRIEAAIPLRELTSEPVAPREVWSIGLQRVIPQHGTLTWPVQASLEPALPETLGFLQFDP